MGVLAAAAVGFSIGICLVLLFHATLPFAFFALLLVFLSLAIYLLEKRTLYLLPAVAFLFVALGMGRALLVHTGLPSAFVHDLRHRVTYTGTVTSDPDVRDSTLRIPVTVTSTGETTTVLAVTPRTTSVAVGDHVRITGTLLRPEPFDTGGGRTFAYDKYLAVRGITALVEYGSVSVDKEAPWYSLPAALARVKHWFLRGPARALPEPTASLAGGVVIGGKTGLGSTIQDAFVKTGLVQIIVLSGYNVMIVADWVMRLFATLQVSRTRRAIAGGLALLLFVGVAGFSATALRATFMALIALYARATGKSYAASRALFVVVLFMLLVNPTLLPYDPGFDLSIVATAGLIWLAPLLSLRLTRIKNKFWNEAVATTLAAQIAVVPLLLYETGTLSVVAIFANVLVAPLVPLTMAFAAFAGVVGATLGALFTPIALFAGVPAYLLTSAILALAQWCASLSWAAYTIPAFPFALVLFAYAGLAAVVASKRASIKDQSILFKNASTYVPFSAGR